LSVCFVRCVRIRFEGEPYYLYTLTSWFRYVEDLVREMTCVDRFEVEARESDFVRIYVNDELVFEGLPDNEGALAEILIHELRRRGFTCSESELSSEEGSSDRS